MRSSSSFSSLAVLLWAMVAALLSSPMIMAAPNLSPPSTLQATYSGTPNFNDATTLGISNIDKITNIKVFTTNYLVTQVISKIQVTYLLTNGTSSTLTHGGGSGTQVASIDFNTNDLFLNYVEARTSILIYYLKFCRSDGMCFGPYGGDTTSPSTDVFQNSKSVIKAFYGHDGNLIVAGAIDGLSVYYEVERIHHVDMTKVTFTQSVTPFINSDLTFKSTSSVDVLDNFASSKPLSVTRTFSEDVHTSETSTVSTPKTFPFTVTNSAGSVSFKYSLNGTNFTLATSFSNTATTVNFVNFTVGQQLTYPINAKPRSKVTATLLWKSIQYIYTWSANINVYYANNYTLALPAGSFEGSISGSQAFTPPYVHYDIVRLPSSMPSRAPSHRPSAAPTRECQNKKKCKPWQIYCKYFDRCRFQN